jgi:di/tripeptidase
LSVVAVTASITLVVIQVCLSLRTVVTLPSTELPLQEADVAEHGSHIHRQRAAAAAAQDTPTAEQQASLDKDMQAVTDEGQATTGIPLAAAAAQEASAVTGQQRNPVTADPV